jgi:leucyl-tRNA synthetase
MSKTSTSQPARDAATDGDRHPHRYTALLADEIETRWQARWEGWGTFRVPNPGDAGFDAARPKFYCLDMFPYPSAAGLHVGHPEGYTATDIVCRYRRHCGDRVLHPMGWDAFGLPAEQYAIQTGVHPARTTRDAIDAFRRQLKRFGFCYDWSREFATIDEPYYRWTQWIWLQAYHAWYDARARRARPLSELLEELAAGTARVGPEGEVWRAGDAAPRSATRAWNDLAKAEQRRFLDGQRLVYLGEQMVNWCPKLGTVLANEEVIDGRSERGGFPVHRKPLRQWMFRITAYAERLLDDLEALDWPASTKSMQREWIGRSEGAEIDFPLADPPRGAGQRLRVYTTRPDTIFGATFMVVAPEHPLVAAMLADPRPRTDAAKVRAYVEAARNRADVDRTADRAKTGVFSGFDATNPAAGARIPIWIADYVLMGYGHGAIMAVPGQDQRDWDFARAFGLPIVRTVRPPDGFEGEAYAGDGPAIHSGFLDGLTIDGAKRRIVAWLEERHLGRGRVNFKLRDWLFSRQRYWGEPFPVVFDAAGDHHPVDESHLPVVLPALDDYAPVESSEPQPLLAKAVAWMRTTAGAAGVRPDALPPDAPVTRETNTMPGWAGSCWYYLRFCDPGNDERLLSREAEAYWLDPPPGQRDASGAASAGLGGVDLYVGGAEHAVLHLLYARFWHKILFDLGIVHTPEPFRRLFHQGMITSHAYQRRDKSLVPVDEVRSIAGEEAERLRRTGSDVVADGEGRVWIETATGEPVTPVVAKMSKSLKNVINPDDVIREYGADTFRLYEMYMGPLDAAKPWDTESIGGLFRFLQRAWRLAVDEATGRILLRDEPDPAVERQLHRTIDKVGRDIEALAFNTAIAALITFVNDATKAGGVTASQLERFAIVLSPFAPHLAEELRARLGGAGSIADEPWPACDEAMLRDEEIELPVQLEGKVRARIRVPTGASTQSIQQAALADERVAALLAGKTVRKVIVVPGKIVNVVTGS